MSLWKACAAFFRPKGMQRNSKSPNGVMTAVLGMDSRAIGIWWYPRIRSTFEKILAPERFELKS